MEKSRCDWCGDDPLLIEYHDTEWGFPAQTDNELFERMSLQIFQAGLNWKIILGKRHNFHTAFAGFNIARVARFGEAEQQELLADTGIIRNRLKISAVLKNARTIEIIQKESGSFQAFIDSQPPLLAELQKVFRNTFSFMGPEITRMFVMNIGKIPPPHDKDCWRNGRSG